MFSGGCFFGGEERGGGALMAAPPSTRGLLQPPGELKISTQKKEGSAFLWKVSFGVSLSLRSAVVGNSVWFESLLLVVGRYVYTCMHAV